ASNDRPEQFARAYADDRARGASGASREHAFAQAAPAEIAFGDVFAGVFGASADRSSDGSRDDEASEAGGGTAEAGGGDPDGDFGGELERIFLDGLDGAGNCPGDGVADGGCG